MSINVNVCHDAVMVHCRERGDEMIVGDLSHVHIYEQGGSAQVSVPPGPLHLFSPRVHHIERGVLCLHS